MGDLVEEARALLKDGTTPEEAFIALAVENRQHYEVALAVCVAVGNSEADAIERLTADDAFWADDTDAARLAWLLQAAGVFDLHVELSAEDLRVADELKTDFRAYGPRGVGYRVYFERLIKSGRLDEARRFLEEHPERR